MTEDFHKQTTLPDLARGQPRFPLPQKIGPYKIESLLNRGGMSVLYLASHPETAYPIVIKVLLPKYLKNKEMMNRFLNEAEVIKMTNHPNIIRLYGQGEWEKGLYIAMEFIQGISLRQFIQQKTLLPKRALEIILQVAYALCHLHTHGVIHRDLKPENILITENGEIKVIDFGIAHLQADLEKQRITQKKRLMGTPIYMSPEQKENPSAVSFGSDIYSLGIIAYELVLGRLSHGVVHLSLLPKSLRKILDKALKINPKERYQDIVDFITDISQYLRTLTDEASEEEMECSDELLEIIQESSCISIPKKSPDWPQIEIGIAVNEGVSLSGLYLDFFQLSKNRYCIVLAEPLKIGPASLLHTASLRGYVRMALQQDHHPLKILQMLNETLHSDPMGQKFGLSLLMLTPDQDLLSFISCSYTDLWHLPELSKKVRILATPNSALGQEAGATLLETVDNFNSGDTLIVHSAAATSKEDPAWAADHALLAPKPQAEQILHHLTSKKAGPVKRSSAVITIQRIF